jgi:TRAP-type C4-dicarboxylate transport system substrate-binding protein
MMTPTIRKPAAIKRCAALFVAVAALACLALPLTAQTPILVKMATLVPTGSTWELILKETAVKWSKLSGGRVKVNLYAGGVKGDDPEVVRQMRLGTVDAAVLTAVGVAAIDKSVYALGVPMMYDSYEELYYVLDKLRPRLESSLDAKGFVVLNWADGGWVHFFSKSPAATPDDLRKEKLFQWADDSDSIEIWKSAGFPNVRPLPSTELASSIQSGLVSAFGAPPQVAVITQYYNHAKNMTDLKWNLLLGATVIRKAVWEKIPADVRPALVEAAQEAGRRLREDIRNSADKDVAEMKKRGLNVVAVPPAARAQWLKMAEGTYPSVRGKIVPADVFDEAMKYRDEYRKTKKK